MDAIVENIRKIAKDLLSRGEVASILGYRRGSIPMSSCPFLAKTPQDADLLWWDDFCVMNLANFIPKRLTQKIAVFAKGCDARNLVLHHLEKRIDLYKNIMILGIPCRGMIDAAKIRTVVGPDRFIREIGVSGDAVAVTGSDFELALERNTVLRQACMECRYPNPIFAHQWVAERNACASIRPPADPEQRIFTGAPEDRYHHITQIFSDCILCYACRDACPLCYCQTCFVDRDKTLWLGDPWGELDKISFHFLRAFHMAGRCTDCGACESACPSHIPVRLLAQKLTLEIKAQSGYEPGIDIHATLPEHVFRPDYHEGHR